MQTSLDLLSKALASATSQAALCRELQVSGATLTMARTRGRLSPTIAGAIARRIGEPVEHWVAVAAMEAEPPSKARDAVRKAISAMQKL